MGKYKYRGIVDFTEKMTNNDQSYNKQMAAKEAYED